jgi:hypothetical protein
MNDNMIDKLPCILALFAFVSCMGKNVNVQTGNDGSTTRDTITIKENIVDELRLGRKIIGNFDGKSPGGYAYIMKVREGEGNPIDDDNATTDEYAVYFSNEDIAPLPINCCDAILIFEGDLNGDGVDELSVFQSPMNGCTYYWRTFTHKAGEWKELFDGYLIPTGCDALPYEDELLNMVVQEDGNVYYHERDAEGNWVKTNADLK